MYGKATETAIAAMSRLAEVYNEDDASRLSATDIAESRGLQRPFVAKVLSTLSQAGLVDGVRGPGGGFRLARHPRDILLYDVFCLFEREDTSDACPFGGGICGIGEKCPLHDKLVDVKKAVDVVLNGTSFDDFSVSSRENGQTKKAKRKPAQKRESFRATRRRS